MAFCSSCGNQLADGTRFCGSCGQTVAALAGIGDQLNAGIASAHTGLALAHVGDFFSAKQEFVSCKIFEGLFTDVAVSESGYLGFYRPYVPSLPGRMLWEKLPERPEYFEFFHVSQINDIDIDVDGEVQTKVSGGAGGAIVGGLIGGWTGALIGSAATSGKVKETTTIHGIDLIIETKDFRNPRRVVPLYKGHFSASELTTLTARPASFYTAFKAREAKDGKGFFKSTAAFSSLFSDVYNNGEPPIDGINELMSTINQLMAAHVDQQANQTAAPLLSIADEILKFKQLLDAGVLTQEEFDTKKRQLMG